MTGQRAKVTWRDAWIVVRTSAERRLGKPLLLEVVAVGLERENRAALHELAKRDRISDEQLAGELIVRGMDRRIASAVGVRYEEPTEPRRRRPRR